MRFVALPLDFGISDIAILINEFAKAAETGHASFREQDRASSGQTGRLS
jgi:hypothetical protein